MMFGKKKLSLCKYMSILLFQNLDVITVFNVIFYTNTMARIRFILHYKYYTAKYVRHIDITKLNRAIRTY